MGIVHPLRSSLFTPGGLRVRMRSYQPYAWDNFLHRNVLPSPSCASLLGSAGCLNLLALNQTWLPLEARVLTKLSPCPKVFFFPFSWSLKYSVLALSSSFATQTFCLIDHLLTHLLGPRSVLTCFVLRYVRNVWSQSLLSFLLRPLISRFL